MKKQLLTFAKEYCLPFSIFLLFSLIFFNKVFQGYFYDPTAFLKIWQPWASNIGGEHIVNHVLSDQVDIEIPSILYFKENLSLWNNSTGFGKPHSTMLFHPIFFPLNLLHLFFNNQLALTIIAILKTTFAGFFMYIFLRSYKTDKHLSILGGILFMFSAKLIVYLGANIANQIIQIPLYFLAIKKIFELKSKRAITFLALVTFSSILSGFPSMTTFVLYFGAIYFLTLITEKKDLKKIPIYLTGCIIGFLISSALLLPTIEFFQTMDLSSRSSNWGARYPIENILHLFNPYYFGNAILGNWTGTANMTRDAIYLGILPILILFPALYLFIKKKSYRNLFFPISLITIIFIAFNREISAAIKFLPMLESNSHIRMMALTPFLASSTVVLFFKELSQSKQKNNLQKGLLIISTILILSILIFSIFKKSNSENLDYLMQTTLTSIVLLSLFSFITWKILENKITKKSAIFLLILICSVDLFKYSYNYNPFTTKGTFYPQTEELTFLEENLSQNERIMTIGRNILPSTNLAYNIPSIQGHFFSEEIYKKYMQKLDPEYLKIHPTLGYFNENTNIESPLMDYFNIKYLVTNNNFISSSNSKFQEVYRKNITIFENTNLNRKAIYQVEKIIPYKENSKLEIIDQIENNFQTNAYISEKKLPNENTFTISENDQIEIIEYRNDKIVIDSNTKNPAFIKLADKNYPGWKAYINGEKTELYEVDLMFRGILIPKGKNQIVLKYEPKSFKYGIYLSLIGIILLILIQIPFRKILKTENK